MTKSVKLVVAFLFVTTVGVNAQTAVPQTTNSTVTSPVQNNGNSNLPYSNSASYNTMDANMVPQSVRSTFGTEYNGVNDAKWESNNDVYRSSFLRDGKEMSVIYDKSGKMRETRSSMNMADFPMDVQNSLKGKTAGSYFEIKTGNNTYYSTQIKGQDMYYDPKGKSFTIPSMPKK